MNLVWLMVLSVPFMLTVVSTYHQSDYTITSERVDVPNYNRSYLKNVTCGLVHFNRTYRAINASGYLLKDLSNNFKVEFQALKFLSNEYRFFPLTITFSACKELVGDAFGLRESMQKSCNFNLRCPFRQGFYKITYGMMDFSLFPPYIPGGRYKAEMKIIDGADLVFQVDYYGKVEEVIKKWEN